MIDPFVEYERQAEAKMTFCLRTGIAPSEYEELTPIEVRAALEAAKKLRGRN